ncbi:acetyl-CoA carboxylase biotin carboxyl carrier protein [Saccharothrix carnea]|uniref:Biotin carboxyl carrier protein of acetyl-CoA carboxylase n=1 Tax=Saccharothrix carnea TaxID=1280637 RepID=A0A2P8I2I9_SACCR|nr:biotin/lipoyl-containing protein [Saccharothrix carnea]PSL52679.1 acetyl-CoA carboxylase biotin carboxyl carrier protein [Saccharothrix carnea]
MTKSLVNHLGHDFDGDLPHDVTRTEPPGELLERLRDSAVRLIAQLPTQPAVLRMRAGEVSVEVEWATPDQPTGQAPGPPPAVPPDRPVAATTLDAAMVGVFYRGPHPGAAPFTDVGDTVEVGTQIGIIEAMKLMIPVEADRAGTVTAVLKADGEPVEYGEPLFALDAG